MSNVTLHKARAWEVAEIERAADQTTELEIWVGDTASATTVTSGTYSLIDANGTAQIDAQTVTVTSSIATYAITSSELASTLPLGDGWQEVWTLTISGTSRIYKRPAALVRQRLHCPIANADILELHPEWTTYPSGDSSWDKAIWQAWKWTLRRLRRAGRSPTSRVLSPEELYDCTLYKACANVARSRSTYVGTDGWREDMRALAADYDQMAKAAWDEAQPIFDLDDGGDPNEAPAAARPVVFLSNSPRFPYSGGGW